MLHICTIVTYVMPNSLTHDLILLVTLGLCGDLENPVNGGRSSGVGPFRYASYISFYCNEGFDLLGERLARCVLKDSPQTVQWDNPTPYCQCKSRYCNAIFSIIRLPQFLPRNLPVQTSVLFGSAVVEFLLSESEGESEFESTQRKTIGGDRPRVLQY